MYKVTGQPAFCLLMQSALQTREVQMSNSDFQTLHDIGVQASDALLVTDASGTVEYVNSGFTEMTGYDPVEVIGKNPSMLSSGQTAASQYKNLWDTVLSGKPWSGILINRKKTGEIYHDYSCIYPMLDIQGQVNKLIGFKTEISSLQEAKLLNAAPETDFFSPLFSNPFIGICFIMFSTPIEWTNIKHREKVLDELLETMEITAANSAFSRLYGIAPGDIAGMKAADLFRNTASGKKFQMQQAFDSGTASTSSFEEKCDGTEMQVTGCFTSLCDRRGRITGLCVLQHELSQENPKTAEESTPGFLENAGHTLLTPLNAVMGFSQLADRTDSLAEVREYMRKIRESSQELIHVIQELLTIYGTQRDIDTEGASPFNIRNTMQSLCDQTRELALGKPIEVHMDIDPSLPEMLIGKVNRIHHILKKIIENAVQYTLQGTIALKAELVSLSEDSAEVCFTISDTGIGIAPEHMERIFQPFYVVCPASFLSKAGAGLGLTSAKQFSDLIGADLKIASEIGKGTSVTLAVKLTAVKSSTEAPVPSDYEPKHPHSGDLAGIKVLVVEDNLLNQELIDHLLRSIGAVLRIASSGEEGLSALEEDTYDVALMDIHLPGISGYETVRRIRINPAYEKLPIIAVTANTLDGEEKRCLDAGMNDYLPKPIDFEQFTKKISSWVSASKPAPEMHEVLNTSLALQRIDNDIQLYRNILTRFLSNHEQQVSKLGKAAAAADWSDAEQTAHTMKGIAGYIGAASLYETCRLMEEASSRGDSTSMQQLLIRLDKESERIHSAAADYLSKEDAQKIEKTPVSKGQLKAELSALAKLLEQYDLAALEVFASLGSYKTDEQFQKFLELLEPFMSSYDFDSASENIKNFFETYFS